MLAYRRHEDNRRRQLKLGDYPGVSLKQARQLAEVEIGRVATGEDPKGERDGRKAGSTTATVAEVAELYLTEYAQEHKRPKGYAMDRWQLESYVLPRWADRPVDQVTKLDVRELLEDLASGKLAARGKPTKVAPRTSPVRVRSPRHRRHPRAGERVVVRLKKAGILSVAPQSRITLHRPGVPANLCRL